MRDLRHFLFAAVAVTFGLGVLASFLGAVDRGRFKENQVLTAARAVAWVVQQEEILDEPPEDLAQRFIVAVGQQPATQSAFVLKKTRILLHSDPAQSGRRLDRESLADKALYDAAREMGSDVRKNDEEREKKPDLDFEPYGEAELADAGEGVLAVRVPVKVDGRFRSMAQVASQPAPLDTGYPLLLFLGLAIAVLLYAGLRTVLPTPGRLAVGTVLVAALALVGTLSTVLDWRDGVREKAIEREAALLTQLADAGLNGATPPEQRQALAHYLARDARGRASGDLVDLGAAKVGTPAPGRAYPAGDSVAVYDEAFRAHKRSGDARTLGTWGGAIATVGVAIFLLGALGFTGRATDSFIYHRRAYGYLSPAMLGLGVLVFIPVVYGIVLGFTNRIYNDFQFAGLTNYVAILSDFDVTHPQNFYFTLGVTFLWTTVNVVLHVSIGLFLALMLNDQMLKARGVFRVLLIVPWAVPNYITALIWKQMFHREFGAINFFLAGFGVEPIAWFQSFWTSFFTNVATNTWLGFPFMMVVSLGALQSIPADLYEAAVVDGATRWQRFKDITLPLLMPALVPAVIVGSVWTFNMFNIIYLVSAGQPNGATDILITEAFRWAFERDNYGYAAAYSTIIFVILLVFTIVTNRITGATKGAFE